MTTQELRVTSLLGREHKPSPIKGWLLPFDREQVIGSFGSYFYLFVYLPPTVVHARAPWSPPLCCGLCLGSCQGQSFLFCCHRKLYTREDQPSGASTETKGLLSKPLYGRSGPVCPPLKRLW